MFETSTDFSEDLIASAFCGILAFEEAGQCVLANAVAAEIVGTTVENVLKQNFRELKSWRESGMLALAETVLATGQKQQREFHSVSSYGRHLWISTKFSVFAKGGRRFLLLILEDTTERKKMEEALRNSEQRYRVLLDQANDAILIADAATGQLLDANEQAQKLTGYSLAEIRRMHQSQMHPPDLANSAAAGFFQDVEAGTVRQRESCLQHRDGKVIPVEISARVIEVAGQALIQGIFRDLTERKESEEQLRKLSRAVEQSPVSIVITDRLGNIEYVNPKFVQITGYSAAEVLGQNPRILKSGDPALNAAQQYKQLWTTILAGQEWHGEFHNRKKNGDFFWEAASISPILDAGGKITHFLALKEDITRQKQLEDEFRQAQKMEAFGRLAAGVAHDFNNMLTAIMGNVQIVAMEGALSAAQREPFAEIKKAAERAANLTRQLLLFSRRKAMQLKVVDVNEVVENLGKMLRRLIGEDITLQERYNLGDMHVLADAGMLEQALLNLSVNSRDAMPKGGELTIETSVVTFNVAVARRRPGQFVCLSVSDTGTGMPSQVLDHIFEPFFTTKEVGKGTGLGLATVFGIVEQHQGWIEVASEVGHGTTFNIYLPQHASKEDTEFTLRPESLQLGGAETILVVEDDPAVRSLARNLLQQLGYKIHEAESPPAALEIWKQHRAGIDLVFTDMVMPGRLNGLDMFQLLSQDKPGLKVVYTSGYTDGMLKEGSALRHAPNFLQKPYTPDELFKTIRAALDK
jgi:two-component system NtrC family sensor kinase